MQLTPCYFAQTCNGYHPIPLTCLWVVGDTWETLLAISIQFSIQVVLSGLMLGLLPCPNYSQRNMKKLPAINWIGDRLRHFSLQHGSSMTGNLPRLELGLIHRHSCSLVPLKIVLHQIGMSGDTQIIYKLLPLCGIWYFHLHGGYFSGDKWDQISSLSNLPKGK